MALVGTPVHLGTPLALAIFVAGAAAIWINYDSDRQVACLQEQTSTLLVCTYLCTFVRMRSTLRYEQAVHLMVAATGSALHSEPATARSWCGVPSRDPSRRTTPQRMGPRRRQSSSPRVSAVPRSQRARDACGFPAVNSTGIAGFPLSIVPKAPVVMPTHCRCKCKCLCRAGWWGLSRHFHYVPEIAAAFLWTLPNLFSRPAAYFYVVFLTLLLTDRAFRDDARCKAKYGADWDKYCQLVPYRMVSWRLLTVGVCFG